MDISSLNVIQSCWCGNEGKTFSFLCNNFVDFTHFRRLHLLYQSQFSTSEEDAGIRVLSSCRPTDQQFCLAAIPWTFTYRSLPPLISVPAFMQASKPCNRLPTDPLATSCGCVVVVSRSKRSKTMAHSGPDAIRAFRRAHPSPMSARLHLQSSHLSTFKYISVNQKK